MTKLERLEGKTIEVTGAVVGWCVFAFMFASLVMWANSPSIQKQYGMLDTSYAVSMVAPCIGDSPDKNATQCAIMCAKMHLYRDSVACANEVNRTLFLGDPS